MLRNPKYIYGPTDVEVPANLHFGDYMLRRLLEYKDAKIINGQTQETITLGQVAQHSMNLAVSLTRLGVRKGDVVGLCSENRLEFWSSVIGTALSGAVMTTFNMTYTKGEITHVIGISKPKFMICSELAFKTHEKTFRSLRHIQKLIIYGDRTTDVSYNDLVLKNNVKHEDFLATEVKGQEDLAFILYSSGTTGLPKGAMLTHLNCLNTFCHPRVEPPFDPIVLNVNPWFHTMGLMAGLLTLAGGRTLVYLPRFELDLYLRTIEKYKVTVAQVVPPILVALTKTVIKYDVSSVMIVYCGAAPLSSEVSNAVQKIFPNAMPVLQAYGMTECTLAVTMNTNIFQAMPGCVGEATYSAIIKVIDLETKEPLGPNKAGEVCVKGGVVMKGYVGKDRKEDFDDEGFFRTGDVAYYDEQGNFYIVDRLKELIKYKAFQVAPAEIEAVLLQHAAVRDAGVVGAPDARAGELPRAFVALQPGASATAEELQAFVAERVSHLMSQVAPAEIEAVLLQHAAVRDAGVVGAPDARAGELPRAFVALQPGASATAEELQAFVAERVSHLMSQVAPAEIEAVLLQHPAVRDAGVVGAPDARAGELPRAFVALQPGASATAEELQAFVAERVSHLMSQVAPAEIEAVLLQHAAVRDAGVVGAPDARAGELPRAFVALQPGASATAEELQAFVAERVSHLMSQVAPAEIEAVLLQHPAVRDAGVVGAPDARAGELPRAFVALQPGASATAEELQAFVAERVSHLMSQVAPAEIEAVLLQHAAVRDAGVVGAPDARAGELPRAFVALQPGASATAEELQAFVAERVSHLMSQVAPAEIEAVLLQHPAVRDAGVVGAPDARAGELPRAFVALQPGASATAEELQAFVAERVSHLMSQVAPAEIEAVLLQHAAVRDAGVVGAPDARAGELPRAFVALQPGASATAEELQAFVAERVSHLMSQVAPAEIEAVLLQHAAVRDAGVVGAPDARAGELPRAFVALQPGASATAEELQAFVAERLSKPKHLRGGVRFVKEIPKNPSGKILRRELRAMSQEKSKL